MMGDLDIKGALSSITSEALLEAAILVVIASLLIIILTITMVVPVLVEPSFENMVAIFGALGLALGFAFKDYANSLIAGIVTLYEMPYRPGDWIEVNGQYGEVLHRHPGCGSMPGAGRANGVQTGDRPVLAIVRPCNIKKPRKGGATDEPDAGLLTSGRQHGCELSARCCRRLRWSCRWGCRYLRLQSRKPFCRWLPSAVPGLFAGNPPLRSSGCTLRALP